MSQARRKSAGRGRQKGAASHGFGMFAAGAVVGAVAASFVMGLASDDPESIGRGIEHMISASKNRFTAEEAAPPPAPVEKRSTEFDFYMVLPEVEHIVPDQSVDPEPAVAEASPAPPAADTSSAADDAAEPPAAVPTPARSRGHYELQAGAFVRMADADRLKAELALKGLSSRIQRVTIEGRGEFFRVRLGPFADTDALEAADRQLGALGIKALRLKVASG